MGPDMQAYWISPSGKAIEVPELHITSVVDEPKKFGFKKADLQKVFDKYNEPYGHEGYARDDILTKLIQKGWIRVRYAQRQATWTLQSDKLSGNVKNLIFDFVAKMVNKKEMSPYAGIRIVYGSNNKEITGEADEVIDFSLFESNGLGTPEKIDLIEFVTLYEYRYTIEDVLTL